MKSNIEWVNIEWIKREINLNKLFFTCLPIKYRNNLDIIIHTMKIDGSLLSWCGKDIRNNKEVVLEAVKNYGLALGYVSERLRDDEEIVLEAIKKNGWVLRYASEKLKNNKEFVLIAVKTNGDALEYVSERLKDDKDIVLEAVKNDGWSLKYVSERLKDDDDIVLEAFQKSTNTLQYASKRLQNNQYLLIKYIDDFWTNFNIIPKGFLKLSNDNSVKEFFLDNRLDKNIYLFALIPDNLKEDIDIQKEYLKNTKYLNFIKFILNEKNINKILEMIENDNDIIFLLKTKWLKNKKIYQIIHTKNINHIVLLEDNELIKLFKSGVLKNEEITNIIEIRLQYLFNNHTDLNNDKKLILSLNNCFGSNWLISIKIIEKIIKMIKSKDKQMIFSVVDNAKSSVLPHYSYLMCKYNLSYICELSYENIIKLFSTEDLWQRKSLNNIENFMILLTKLAENYEKDDRYYYDNLFYYKEIRTIYFQLRKQDRFKIMQEKNNFMISSKHSEFADNEMVKKIIATYEEKVIKSNIKNIEKKSKIVKF